MSLISLYCLGTKCRTVTDKNGTSYLTMTGKEKQSTLGILGVITGILLLFFVQVFKANIKETSKASQLSNSTIKIKR